MGSAPGSGSEIDSDLSFDSKGDAARMRGTRRHSRTRRLGGLAFCAACLSLLGGACSDSSDQGIEESAERTDQGSDATTPDVDAIETTTSTAPEPDPAVEFVNQVCGSAPQSAVDALTPGALFDGLGSTTGSWFGDGLTCVWSTGAGAAIEVVVYVAPAPDWRSYPPHDYELLTDAAGIPITAALRSGTQVSLPDSAAAAPLLDHVKSQTPAHFAELCAASIESIFGGSLQADRAAERERLCGAL